MKKEVALISSIFIFSLLLTVFSFVQALDAPPFGSVGSHLGGIIGGQQQVCSNTDTSCGTWPNCFDLTYVKYCVNGKIMESYCFSNEIKNRTTAIACKNINIPLNFRITDSSDVDDSADINLYVPGTGDSVGSLSVTGEDSVNSTRDIVDALFKYDSEILRFKIKKLNLTKIVTQPIHITFDAISPEIPNQFVIRAYKVQLPQDFSYDSIELYMKYESNEVENMSSLAIFKCSNYNIATETCSGSWVKMDSVIDDTNKIVASSITGFSAYALTEFENSQTTTSSTSTTTTTPTTTTTSAPPASSSSSSSGTTGGAALGGSSSPGSSTTTTSKSTTTTTPTLVITTATSSQTENATGNQTSQKGTGDSVLATGTIQMITIGLAIPAGAVSYVLLRKYNTEKEQPYRYLRTYKRNTKIKKSKSKKGELQLILQ
jgi:hypothetical protein